MKIMFKTTKKLVKLKTLILYNNKPYKLFITKIIIVKRFQFSNYKAILNSKSLNQNLRTLST